MPALRFELISSERYGRRALAEFAGNQYSGEITTAGLYNVINSAQRSFKELGLFCSLGFRCGRWGLVSILNAIGSGMGISRGLSQCVSTPDSGIELKYRLNGQLSERDAMVPVIRPVLRQYIANLMLF